MNKMKRMLLFTTLTITGVLTGVQEGRLYYSRPHTHRTMGL